MWSRSSEKESPVAPFTKCIAIKDFQGEQNDDLSFSSGEVMTIIEPCDVMYWYLAENSWGRRGVIPITHVTICSTNSPAKKPPPPPPLSDSPLLPSQPSTPSSPLPPLPPKPEPSTQNTTSATRTYMTFPRLVEYSPKSLKKDKKIARVNSNEFHGTTPHAPLNGTSSVNNSAQFQSHSSQSHSQSSSKPPPPVPSSTAASPLNSSKEPAPPPTPPKGHTPVHSPALPPKAQNGTERPLPPTTPSKTRAPAPLPALSSQFPAPLPAATQSVPPPTPPRNFTPGPLPVTQSVPPPTPPKDLTPGPMQPSPLTSPRITANRTAPSPDSFRRVSLTPRDSQSTVDIDKRPPAPLPSTESKPGSKNIVPTSSLPTKYVDQKDFLQRSGWFTPNLETVLCKMMYSSQITAFTSITTGIYIFTHKHKRDKRFVGKSRTAYHDLVQMFHRLYEKKEEKLNELEREIKYHSPDADQWSFRICSCSNAVAMEVEANKKILDNNTLQPLGLNSEVRFTSKESFYQFAEVYAKAQREKANKSLNPIRAAQKKAEVESHN